MVRKFFSLLLMLKIILESCINFLNAELSKFSKAEWRKWKTVISILFTWILETPTSLEHIGAALLMMGLTPENEP